MHREEEAGGVVDKREGGRQRRGEGGRKRERATGEMGKEIGWIILKCSGRMSALAIDGF